MKRNLQLKLYPDSALCDKSLLVTNVNSTVDKLIKGMAEIRGDVSLAALQVGVLIIDYTSMLRIFC